MNGFAGEIVSDDWRVEPAGDLVLLTGNRYVPT